MASLLTTMLVPLQSSSPSQALPPHCTLKESASCVTINSYVPLESPEPARSSPSPAARKPREDLSVDCSHPSSNARSRNQFKPARANKGTSSYQLRQFAEATLGSGSLRKAVKLPEGEDLNEWLAVNGRHRRCKSRAAPALMCHHSRRLL
jgi:MOB kinase activator 1